MALKQVMVRMEPSLHRAATKAAKAGKMSFSELVRLLLRMHTGAQND